MPDRDRPQPGQIWQHFKGTKYKICLLSRDTDNPHKKLVTYTALEPSAEPADIFAETNWTRDLAEFLSDYRLPSGEVVQRFTLIE